MEASIYHGPLPLLLDGQEHADSPNGTLDAITFEILVEAPDWRTSLATAGIIKNTPLPIELFPGLHSMWAQDHRLKNYGSATATIAINAIGLLQNTEKRKTTLVANANRVSIGPQENKPGPLRDVDGNLVKFDMAGWVVPEGGGTPVPRQNYPKRIFGETTTEAPAWSIAVPKFTLNSTWFTTTQPDHTLVGTTITPPLTIDLPAFPFSSTDWEDLQFRLNAPSGWVLDNRTIEPLFTGYAQLPQGPHFTAPPAGTAASGGLWAVVDTITYYLTAEPT